MTSAAVQILGLRSFVNEEGKTKGYDAFHDQLWRAPDLLTLLKNPQPYVDAIPQKDRWNIFYTVASCKEGKRDFAIQDVIVFDIDGIHTDKIDEYISVVLSILKLTREKTGIVFSGHGLHFIIGLAEPIRQKTFFKKNRHHYRAVLDKINDALRAKELPGKADPAVFDARRILRLPGTVNRKPDQQDIMAILLNGNIERVPFVLHEHSTLPEISDTDQIAKEYLRKYPKVDNEAILEGCIFLKWCKDKPNEVSEPQWYAMLSILGRMEDGYKLCHEYSQGHAGYTQEETDTKIEQATESSGPRTCSNIAAMWSGCVSCEHYQGVKSPILLRGKDHIKTEYTGFHNIPFNASGMPGKPTPNYEDLRKFFMRHYSYKGLGGSRMVQVWRKTHYEYLENVFIEGFAQEHFNPVANTAKVREFRELVCRTHLTPVEWFEHTTRRKMNFLNGILDLSTWDFLSHTEDIGFRSVLPYEYNPHSKAPVFEKMLHKITGGNESIQKVILEYIGYCLSNDNCWAQKAVVLVGLGANGKSTLMDVFKKLAGDGNYATLTMEDLKKSEYNRQMLDRKLFNFSEETPTKALLEHSMFKTLVTGGEIQVRSPYKEPYSIKNNAKLIFSCNELPKAVDTTYGFYRRLIIIPFNQCITKEDPEYDPHIDVKLADELPGIFNLAMEGYKRLCQQRGFSESKKLTETLEQYQDETDTVRGWAKENVRIHPLNGATTPYSTLKDMYLRYKSEVEYSGEYAVTRIKFTQKLRSTVPDFSSRYTVKKDTDTNKAIRVLLGIECGEGINLAE